MSPRPAADRMLGDALASRRGQRVVGRAAEVELVRAALGADELPFAVLFVHGPGGIGKTTLLEVLAGVARAAGADVRRLDGRDLSPTPSAVLGALGVAVDDGDGEAPLLAGDQRPVLLVDAYEKLQPLDRWVRMQLLPRLPVDALTIIASRHPPSDAWRTDPAWRDLLRLVSLRNLAPSETARYLEASGVDQDLHARLHTLTRGHPLALSLVADLVVRGGPPPEGVLPPRIVDALLRRYVDTVPSAAHRRALEVCALARTTTEALLRDGLAVDAAGDLFAWLRGVTFVEEGPHGLAPHDLVRDALDADLRWRDPDAYADVFRRVRRHVHARVRDLRGGAQHQAVFDEKFLFRSLRSVLSPVDWGSWGGPHPEPLQPADADAVVALVAGCEGPESAALAQRWLDRQPEAFSVVRRDDGSVRGAIALLDLTAASDADREADPGTLAAWAHAQRHAPPRPGEVVTQTRFVVDAEAPKGPSPTLNAVPVLTLEAYLRTPNLAWDYLTLADPDPWDEYFAIADLPRAPDADFIVDGRRHGLFCHDFRVVGIDELAELWTERALAEDVAVAAPRGPDVVVLSQTDFADAVRQALKDLHHADLLARNPLAGSRLLQRGDGARDAAALEDLVREAVATLRRHPRDDPLLRAVEATYLRPSATQEAAAAYLGVPFSTYRRHLAKGVARVVEVLWDEELYGSGEARAARGEQR